MTTNSRKLGWKTTHIEVCIYHSKISGIGDKKNLLKVCVAGSGGGGKRLTGSKLPKAALETKRQWRNIFKFLRKSVSNLQLHLNMKRKNTCKTLDMQGLKMQVHILRKLLKMYFTKMRKLTEKEEDTGNTKAETGERQRKSQVWWQQIPAWDCGLDGKKLSVQARAGCKAPGDASSEVSTCMQMNFR